MQLAEQCYQTAIVAAARLGRILASALASERYGAFLLNKQNDPEEAKHKFDVAIRRKVQILREKHPHLWRKPTEVVVGLSEDDKRVSTISRPSVLNG
jgi:hypothetical protein